MYFIPSDGLDLFRVQFFFFAVICEHAVTISFAPIGIVFDMFQCPATEFACFAWLLAFKDFGYLLR